jgi:hypothetical protein
VRPVRYSLFPLGVPHRPNRELVSSARHIAHGQRIPCTTRSLLLCAKFHGYRIPEFGIRTSLSAQLGELTGLVSRQGLQLSVGGLDVGVAEVLVMGRAGRSTFENVVARDGHAQHYSPFSFPLDDIYLDPGLVLRST